ncbi:hypothetical protein KFE25_003599 [Diacronema lutheri]|uniref:Major facilitator superfamily (MFS) profile domain-containing protein n=3 Tax=Diacronema lutheri TaxID=2081491 RepID=A0A8J6C8Y4_DIALT|nr:hypothetical protein KFE25_003599 [Diacronema lutheri]
MHSNRSDRSDASSTTPAKPRLVPRALSAMGLARTDSLAGIKQSLLRQGRSETLGDLRSARIVKFNRGSALADLSYLALPGLTSRVARRARIPTTAATDTVSRTASYLRLEMIGASASGLSAAEREQLLPSGGDEYVEETGLTPALGKSVGVALISSFMYGFNGANMNTQAGVQRAALGIPTSAGASADNVWALCVSLFCIGALLGCNLSGSLADKWGRKKYLLVSSFIFAAGGALEAACALPPAPAGGGPAVARIAMLIVGRLVTGVACGGATVVVPMYLGEVSPAALRGTLGTAFQLCSVVAMFAAQVLGLGSALGTEALWPLVLGLVVLPAVVQLMLGGLLVESPRWLCMVGAVDEAQLTLAHLRNVDATDEQLLEELDLMISSAEGAQGGADGRGGKAGRSAGPTFAQLLRPPTRYPLLIAMALMVLQQFSGINNAFNFSSVFLKANGMDDASVQLIAILMNVGNVLITLLSVFLMDRAGRRALLLISTVGMTLGTGALTVALKAPGQSFTTPLSVLSVVLFVASFGIGLGPVGWLLPAEIMPAETRALASSVAATTNWLANFIASQAFLVIANALGGFAFVPFGACLVLGGFFIALFVPETKGKSLEQIQAELADTL